MIHYRVDASRPHTHAFHLTMTLPAPLARQRLSLPVWIPGSYLVREFARHLAGLQATQRGAPVPLRQLDKATWEADAEPGVPLELSYRVHAFDSSVRAAWLDARRGFFNGTSLFLRAEGHEAEPHGLTLREIPAGWEVATALPARRVDARGRGVYQAEDYDALVDHPVELGRFWRGRFDAHGVPHEFVVAGALPDFDGDRLLADARRICEAQIAFWHPNRQPPFERYVFLLNAVDDGYGGLEHRASTALIAARRDLPQRGRSESGDGYVTLLGLISHEYFHAWNVKRLRPSEFGRLDYTRENYTELLWFFEGFTSYYDDLFLVRTGLIDEARYLRLLAKTIHGVQSTPGRQVQSVAEASFDAWVKYYRQDENTPNATISYYTKGSLVALALDLRLRAEGVGTLDDVMRALWLRSAGGPIREADIAQVLADVGGRPWLQELADWVHGTGELPLPALLDAMGVAWQAQPATLAERLGLKVSESALTGVRVSQVLRGSVGEACGLAPGDELLAVGDWRLRRLDDVARLAQPGEPLRWLVSRDQRLLALTVVLPPEAAPPSGAVVLAGRAATGSGPTAPRAAVALRRAWLGA
ncbi:M61 family metallopeptidase [Piscinibacter sakaiensis]|uniref:Putative protease n=1 Tax=Piscinibacter sakaiensis TaxID=1547922 RepID=A0A0K8NTZ6_PISS1|nr:PDZ domain-containing protein [Piscinibacter sakaiensis]GAP33838.1 putative protease [Piscinibacter sakaiensis]